MNFLQVILCLEQQIKILFSFQIFIRTKHDFLRRLKNIIQNLVEVIVKAIDIGEINVNLSIPDEECINSKNLIGANFVMISLSSNSLLLSENDLEYMFDPYKIVDSSNKKNTLRAMALACIKSYVQILNGVIWIESKILKNTSFNIIIPQGSID